MPPSRHETPAEFIARVLPEDYTELDPFEPEQTLDPTLSPDTPRSRWQFGRFSGRTALASALLVASGAVLHEEPVSAETTQAVAETTVSRTVYRTAGDGVWLHDSPGLHTPLKVVMPEGAQFNVDCFVTGQDNVNGNRLWLQGTYNETYGAVTDYYIDTHWSSTQDLVDQGIEECGSQPAAGSAQEQAPPPEQQQAPQAERPAQTLPGGAAAFYSPADARRVGTIEVNSPAAVTLGEYNTRFDWTPGEQCSPAAADDFPEAVNSRRITTLGGWSIGRLGPTYFLQETGKSDASEDSLRKRDNVDYIVLFDPGSSSDYESACDSNARHSMEMAAWLREDPNNNLVIFAGDITEDKDHGHDGYLHQGIQEGLFRASIRGQDEIADQVLVCNYDLSHEQTYVQLKDYMNKPKITNPTQCPNGALGWRP